FLKRPCSSAFSMNGLFKKEDKNEISIRFSKAKEGLILLEIVDSGIGITEQLSKTTEHKSLARKITNERLEKMRITHKSDLTLETENITGEAGEIEGYRVRLNLPSKTIAA
ncbi:MAG: hypothetical protein AAFY41_15580, partial [Bacteroidota bacterium]